MQPRKLSRASLPRAFVADEPTTGLDAAVRGDLLDLLADLKRETGASLLPISHVVDAVLSLADRVTVMRSGRIVERRWTRGGGSRARTDPRCPRVLGATIQGQ